MLCPLSSLLLVRDSVRLVDGVIHGSDENQAEIALPSFKNPRQRVTNSF